MQIDLPVGYYLDNFFTILDFVDEQYEDLLNAAERVFSRDFRELALCAQRFYVRMICRVGPHFRSDKLSYTEITDIPLAADELASSGFLAKNGNLEIEEMLELLTKPEIADLVDGVGRLGSGGRTQKREDLVAWVIENISDRSVREYCVRRFDVYTPIRTEIVLIYRLLFFGNLRQDLTEFVLLDLGLYRYENYEWDQPNRLFETRTLLDNTFKLIQMREQLADLMEAGDEEGLLDLTMNLPDPLGVANLIRLHSRILNEAGRFWERMGMFPEAVDCYERAFEPPARERRVRKNWISPGIFPFASSGNSVCLMRRKRRPK